MVQFNCKKYNWDENQMNIKCNANNLFWFEWVSLHVHHPNANPMILLNKFFFGELNWKFQLIKENRSNVNQCNA